MHQIDGGRVMAHSAMAIWDGFRHPRAFLRSWVKRAPGTAVLPHEAQAACTHACNSAERLERIAAYARSGYFHIEYTAGMFVVPLDIPPD
ncbi:hypothetical protein Bxe_C0119 [Paraburkholderia xenovorans LB400]|uniref:Uncharacterized protein n=1 Tax=Paraburkholderia xenovorans (strain LB400) TaxID=266265 RepID=Q13IP5_PARXL|nr:hypothetical protein Bxe_C0119 [Paraburkholderia xenovorans LB400]